VGSVYGIKSLLKNLRQTLEIIELQLNTMAPARNGTN
jgi:hypothetical protein